MHVTQPICFTIQYKTGKSIFIHFLCFTRKFKSQSLVHQFEKSIFHHLYLDWHLVLHMLCTLKYYLPGYTFLSKKTRIIFLSYIYFKALQWHKTILIYCIGDCLIDRCLTLIFIRNIYLYILLITATDVYMWPVADKSAVSIEHIVPKCHYVWSEIFLSEI